MIPLRVVESDREGFDEPVVELWRDDEFVGMVFWDEDVAVVQVYTDSDGEVFDLGLSDVFRALGLAEAIVTPEEFRSIPEEFEGFDLGPGLPDGEDDDEGWQDEHPATVALVAEFDPLAVSRSDSGEGFFGRMVAFDFIARCNELDLAVVEMEAFDIEGAVLKPRPGLVLAVSLPGMDDWSVFRPAANALAQDRLSDWPTRSSLALAFVVQQPDGETFVA